MGGQADDGIQRGSNTRVAPYELSSTELCDLNVPGKDEQNLAAIRGNGGGVGVCAKLRCDPIHGITGSAADMAARQAAFGENKFPEPPFESE
jgi:hypothetical protein